MKRDDTLWIFTSNSSWKGLKIIKMWVFLSLVFVLPSKQFLAFFQFIWPSDVLNIQNQYYLSDFEAITAILTLKHFCWKFGKADQCDWINSAFFHYLNSVCNRMLIKTGKMLAEKFKNSKLTSGGGICDCPSRFFSRFEFRAWQNVN